MLFVAGKAVFMQTQSPDKKIWSFLLATLEIATFMES